MDISLNDAAREVLDGPHIARDPRVSLVNEANAAILHTGS
jgi:hypothetical protein